MTNLGGRGCAKEKKLYIELFHSLGASRDYYSFFPAAQLKTLPNITIKHKRGEKEEREELLFGYGDSKEGLSDFNIHIGGSGSEGMLAMVGWAVKDRTTSEMPVNVARAPGCRPAGYTVQVLDKAGVPNILWGYWAASVMGDCMPQSVSDFC